MNIKDYVEKLLFHLYYKNNKLLLLYIIINQLMNINFTIYVRLNDVFENIILIHYYSSIVII